MPYDLLRYIAGHFPGLNLDAPLFYRWPVGLRFDLGGRATTPGEMDVVVQRATALYEAVFAPEHMCIVVAQDWPGDTNPPPEFAHLSPLFVFTEREGVELKRPDGQVEVEELEEPEIGPHTLTWVEQAARAFRYHSVFEGIGNADHGRRPAISSRVYFINPLTNVILHMYDDRGLDVIAGNKKAIHSLYHEFNEWILDYDRTRIDQAFAQ